MPPVAMIAVAAFGAISAGAAIAGAIGITAFLGVSIATWSAIGMVGMLVSGLALAASMPKPQVPESSGQQLNMKLTGNDALPVAYGRSATGGVIYHRQTYDASNKTLVMLVALSVGGSIGGVESVRANDYGLTLNGSPGGKQTVIAAIGDTDSKSKMFKNNSLSFYHKLGATPEPQTPSEYSGQPIIAGKHSGIATAMVQAEYKQENFPQGLPKFQWVIRGQRVYDPRKDSTYPGGSGAHRVANPDTWEYSENPQLCALNWTLGRFQNGKKVFGIGATPDEVDIAAFVAGANISDALGWKVGGVVATTDDKFAVLGSLLQAGGAIPIARGAQISCLTYSVKTSIFNIGFNDVVGSAQVVNTAPFRERKNKITPTYREESQFWNLVPGEAVSAAQYVAEDNGEHRSVEVSFPLVQQAAQAHQLATYDLVNTREFLTFEITAKPKLLGVRVGDCVTVTLPDLGINNQKCMVVSRDFDPATWQVKLALRSETDAKHAFALGQSQVAPPSPALTTFDPSNPAGPTAGSWTISDTSVTNETGTVVPALVVSGVNDDPNTSQVIVEFRRQGEEQWTSPREGPAASTQFIITDVVSEASYEVSVSYRTVLGIVSERLVLGPVTAGVQLVAGVRPGGIGWNPTAPTSPITGVPPVLTDLDENGHIDGGMVNGGNGQTVVERFTGFDADIQAATDAIANAQASVVAIGPQIDAVVAQADADLEAARSNLQTQINAVPSQITTARNALQTQIDAIPGQIAAGDAALQSAIDGANQTISTARSDLEAADAVINAKISLTNPAAGTLGQRFLTAETITGSNVNRLSGLETVVGTPANEAGTLRGRVFNLEQTTSEGSSVTAQRISGLETSVGLNDAEGIRARMLTVETATTNGTFATSTRVSDLEARLGAGNGTAVTARLSTVETATTDGRFATASRAQALEATVNATTGGVANLGARMMTVETATTDGRFATATRVSNLEATVNAANGGNANLTARLGTVETATTDGRFASATRVSDLEASNRSYPNLIKNGDFTRGTQEWGKDGGGTFDRYLHGTLGSIGYFNGADYIYTTNYPVSAGEPLSFSFEGDGGSGSYGYLQWIPSYQATQAIAFTGWGNRAKSQNLIAPAGTAGYRLVFHRGPQAQIHLTRVKVNYGDRATNWSDEGSVFDTNARITTVENVTTNGTFATASRATALEATVNAATGGVANIAARLGTVETATTDGRFATASRVQSLEATVNGSVGGNANLNARMGTVETATTDGRFASASRVSVLEAKAVTLPNLLKNSDFSAGLRGWSDTVNWTVHYNPNIGSYVGRYANDASDTYLISDYIPVYGSQPYSLSFNGDGGDGWQSTDARTAVYMSQYDANQTYIQNGDGLAYAHVNQRDWGVRQFASATTLPNTAFVKVVIRKGNNTDGLGVSRIMLNSGNTALQWTDQASAREAAARIATVETATTDGRFSSATRVSALEVENGYRIGENQSMSGRVATVEQATTDGRFATASRVASLEATSNDAINKNSNFAQGFASGAIPPGWGNWSNGTANSWTGGYVSPNAIRFAIGAEDRGISQQLTNLSGGWFVIEATVTLESGSFPGSGILIQFHNGVGGTEVDSSVLHFAAAPDITGTVQGNGTTGKTYRFSLLKNAHANTRSAIIYAMAGWTGFSAVAGKQIVFHEAKIRQATSAEISVGQATTGTSLNARIGSIETATTDGRFATASRVSDLEATVNTGPNRNGQLAARITTVETATTDGRFATASRVSNLEATVNASDGGNANLKARIGVVETATTDGRFASANRVSVLEASNRSLPNLIKNGDFANGFARWERDGAGPASDSGSYYHPTLRSIAWIKNAVGYMCSDFYSINAGDAFSFSFEGDAGGGDGNASLQWLPGYAQVGHVPIPTTWGVRAKSENLIAPPGTTGVRIVIGKGNAGQVHATRVKVNYGAVATNWSNEATDYDTNARIGTVEQATTDGRFATAQRATNLETTVNAPTTGVAALHGRLTTVETATTDGRFATASRVNDLQATLSTRNNLCPNGSFENGLTGITGPAGLFAANNGWGPHGLCYNPGSGTHVINFPKFDCFGSNTHTISGDTIIFAPSNQIAYLDVIWFDSAGNVCGDGPEKPINGQHDFSNSLARIQEHAISFVSPSNAVKGQARAVFGGDNITAIGVRRVKVELGGLPATQYTAEASGIQTIARLTSVETATTDGRFATASSVQTLSARALAQGGNLLKNTDFESGTGGWYVGGQIGGTLAVDPAGEPWSPVGEHTLGVLVNGSGGYTDINSDKFSVETGKWYDFSVYLATHRASAETYIAWCGTDGQPFAYSGYGAFYPGDNGGRSLNNYSRPWIKAQAPGGAVSAYVICRKMATSAGTNSWIWITRPFFGECSSEATGPQPFSHGNARQLSGLITEAKSIAVDTRGRVQATAGLTVQAGNQIAGMKFHATDGTDQSYSTIDFVAGALRVWSPNENTGQAPFEVRNGGVRMKSAFVDRLSVGTSITLGSGVQFRVAVQPIDINVTDGQSVNFGYDLGSNPSLAFYGNNLAPLNAGETYKLYADNLTPTGFIARLKIETPATPSNVGLGPVGSSPNGPASHHFYLDPTGRSSTGSYDVRVNGHNRIYNMRLNNPNPNQPEYIYDDPGQTMDGDTHITVYGWNGGAWLELDTIYVGPQFTSTNGYQDQYFDVTQTVPTGSNISHIGVAVTYKTYPESNVANLWTNYQTQGSGGGQRSATPNGQVSTVTIRPKS